MRKFLIAAALCSACSGNSATGPSPTPTPTPQPSTVTFSGHLSATNGGQALPQQAVAFASQNALTDATGGFSLKVQPTSGMLNVTGTGIVTRGLMFSVTGPRDVAVDAISLNGQFDLNFYRELVRNGFEGGNEVLRRWTRDVNVFLQTGTDAKTLDMLEAVTRETVPKWTNGQFNVAAVERGATPGAREGQQGWLTIKWTADDIGHCGTTAVAGGLMTFTTARTCGCAGFQVTPNLVRHELGHAMGFWHTEGAADTMHATVAQCDSPISARELYHAAIAYRRPVGNTDPDIDSAGPVNLAPARAIP